MIRAKSGVQVLGRLVVLPENFSGLWIEVPVEVRFSMHLHGRVLPFALVPKGPIQVPRPPLPGVSSRLQRSRARYAAGVSDMVCVEAVPPPQTLTVLECHAAVLQLA